MPMRRGPVAPPPGPSCELPTEAPLTHQQRTERPTSGALPRRALLGQLFGRTRTALAVRPRATWFRPQSERRHNEEPRSLHPDQVRDAVSTLNHDADRQVTREVGVRTSPAVVNPARSETRIRRRPHPRSNAVFQPTLRSHGPSSNPGELNRSTPSAGPPRQKSPSPLAESARSSDRGTPDPNGKWERRCRPRR